MSPWVPFAVSVIALLVSVVAVWYAHRQYELNRQERHAPPWTVERLPQYSDGLVLRNGKSWPVYDVEIAVTGGHECMPVEVSDVGGHSAVPMWVRASLEAAHGSVVVTWSRRRGGRVRERWTWPLPF